MMKTEILGALAAAGLDDLFGEKRYVKGTNARATLRPGSLSPWLRRMRSMSWNASGGDYLDDDAKVRARRRMSRAVRRIKRLRASGHDVDASSIAGHIKRNAAKAL